MATSGQSSSYTDLLTAFPAGINSGVQPLLLPKDQCSFAINTTFRGGYATNRSPLDKKTLNFNGDTAVEDIVRNGFFQGAGVYRPDFGSSQVVAQISGRLFTFTENGAAFDVAEITIAGDPNDSLTTQVWMWQAEKWLIISDGSGALPIFYDGVSCRRSYGPSQTLVPVGDVLVVNPATVLAIGSPVTLTLANPYTGPYDITVIFNDAFYQPLSSLTGNITLTNVNDTAGNFIPIGTDIIVNPNLIGYTTASANSSAALISAVSCVIPLYCNAMYRMTLTLSLTSISTLLVGESVTIDTNLGSRQFTVATILGNVITVYRDEISTVSPAGAPVTPPPPAMISIAGGALVQYSSSMGPSVVLGELSVAFTAPAVGGIQSATMTGSYSGPANQLVTVEGKLYLINALGGAGGTTLYLINLNDTAGAAYPAVATLDVVTVPELPACRMGAYGLGQNWISSTDGLSFGPSDIVGASSGTVANNYRDAVLKAYDLSVMGFFRVPVAGEIITSMTFVATLDVSLGQGPLQIGVASGMFSCRAPFTLIDFQGLTNAVSGDMVTAPVTNPILTKSLVGFGPVAQNSTILSNSDTIFRSFEGINSLILARRQFYDLAGNAPISREMTRVIDRDDKTLLSYSSAIVFDNRLRMTCAPNVSSQGVFHMGELVLNYDLISSLRGKAQPVWDGLWTGLNVLQYVQGLFGTTSRAFALTFNIDDEQIELYELLTTDVATLDNGTTRIRWIVETPVLFNAGVKNLADVARMIDGEMYLSDVNGLVDVVVYYRPVFYPCWRPWHTFSVCSTMTATNAKQQVRYALGFGEPDPKDCDVINNQPFREGVGFQLRLEVTGHCKLWATRALAEKVASPAFSKPAGTCDVNIAETCLALDCDVEDDLRTYSLDGLPQLPLPAPPAPPNPFTNQPVYYDVACDPGAILTYIP